ncbi:MAG: lysophospholipid acyltransferase family protein [Proteobacteria bacterium]|nr:lysophospholipid acyltransferase family protein [Pseudomonadota bacterium]
MALKLSSFLQLKPNVFIYQKLGWKMALIYMLVLGKIYFFLKQEEKRKILCSVERVFGDRKEPSEVKAIAKHVFRGIFCHYYEKIFNAYTNIQGLRSFLFGSVTAHRLERLDHALKEGRGVLFITGHYGGIEYIPIYLALKGYPVSVIAKFSTVQLKETLHAKTKPLGLTIIDGAQKNGILNGVIRELKANRVVFIECDEIEEWRPSRNERTHFLGKKIGVDRTINLLYRRTGAEIIFGLLHRYHLQKYDLFIEDLPGVLSKLGAPASSVAEAVLKCFEQFIYRYPEGWYQWKNYSEIRSLDETSVEGMSPGPVSTLTPAFGELF